MLHGLQARPELNGRRGRVLPTTGRGAPPTPPAAGRVAVRLAPLPGSNTLEVISVKAANIKSPHAAAAAAAAASSRPAAKGNSRSAAAAARASQQPQQQQPPSANRQRILELLESEFKLWKLGSTINPKNLRKAGMAEPLIKCGSCGKQGEDELERFITLKHHQELSPVPLPHSVIKLRCLDCFAAMAEAAQMPLSAEGAEQFCDVHMMGPPEVCHVLLGHPRAHWGSGGTKGQMY